MNNIKTLFLGRLLTIRQYFSQVFESSDESWQRKRKELGYAETEPSPGHVRDSRKASFDFEDVYEIGRVITGVIVFVGCWIYAITAYGFLFGVGLGWLPSLIVAFIASFLWPLIVLGLLVIVVLILRA